MADKNATNRRHGASNAIQRMFPTLFAPDVAKTNPRFSGMNFFRGSSTQTKFKSPLAIKKSRDRMFKRSRIASRANAKH